MRGRWTMSVPRVRGRGKGIGGVFFILFLSFLFFACGGFVVEEWE